MAIPLVLLVLAALAAAVLAYGIHPLWAQYPHGIEFILLSRRLEWPLLAVTLILCIALIGMIISGRRRAWWLIGLMPILTLLAHRFALDPNQAFVVNSQPAFVSADQATFMMDEDWVVGLQNDGVWTAYPFASLYPAPLVVQGEQFTPMLLMWSPFANRAVAMRIDRSLKARDLEILSMPANTLLLYNTRLGQFINGVTGRTMQGQKPDGFVAEIPTIKTTWRQWHSVHPETQVLAPLALGRADLAPTSPVLPYYPMPKSAMSSANAAGANVVAARPGTTVALICTTRPCAVLDRDIGTDPVNVSNPPLGVLLLRDPLTGGVKGLDRLIQGDLNLQFRAKTFPRQSNSTASAAAAATMTDTDSGSAWTPDGRAIDGSLKGERLAAIEVDDGVYVSVLRVWYPDLPVLNPMIVPPAAPPRGAATPRRGSRSR